MLTIFYEILNAFLFFTVLLLSVIRIRIQTRGEDPTSRLTKTKGNCCFFRKIIDRVGGNVFAHVYVQAHIKIIWHCETS